MCTLKVTVPPSLHSFSSSLLISIWPLSPPPCQYSFPSLPPFNLFPPSLSLSLPPSLQDKAFMLWQTHLSSLYTSGSLSQLIISEIQNTYYLVNLVDNDYVQGNVLFEVSGHVMSGGSHVTITLVGHMWFINIISINHICPLNVTQLQS